VLTVLVALAGGASSVLLGIVPNPFDEPAAQAPARARGSAALSQAAPEKKVVAKDPSAQTPASKPAAASTQAVASLAATAAVAAAPATPATEAQKPVADQQVAPAKPAPPAAPAPKAAAANAPSAQAPVAPAPSKQPAAAPESEPEDRNDALIAAARKRLADDDAAGAEALARRAVDRDPRDHHAMEVLARSLLYLDRGQEAVSFARKIVDKRRKRVSYRLLLGDALLMVGDQAGARTQWLEAQQLDPRDPGVKQRLR
jgi:Flp pilus assembly protein TadD